MSQPPLLKRTFTRQLRLGHRWVGWPLLIALVLSPLMPQPSEIQPPMYHEDTHSLWVHMRKSFALDHHIDNPRVRDWIEWYQQHPEAIDNYMKDGRPWLYHVFHEVNDRHVPGEIALLPFIESGYNPHARNTSGASGLWQLTPQAASEVGLVFSHDYDPRNDPLESTHAALDYFQWLSDNWYEDDWILMLAVYNAGVGRVNKAIRQANTRNYFKLPLPAETRLYVPRLLALAAIIDAPEHYGIKLPDIPDEPTFVKIRVARPVTLESLGSSALSSRQLRDYNPAYDQVIGRHQVLLVPIDQATDIMCRLKAHSALANDAGEVSCDTKHVAVMR